MTESVQSRPTFLLVHGGGHGAWCWERVEAELTRDGWRSVAVDLPTAIRTETPPDPLPDMYDDARFLLEQLEQIEGPVVVVAHSYGGIPVTEAIADAPNVVHVVYLSAVPIDVGESMAGYFGIPSVEDQGPVMEATTNARDLYFADLTAEDAAVATQRLVPHSYAAAANEVTKAGWRTVPSSYIICERDKLLAPADQEKIAARVGSTVYRIDTSHSPFLSRPAELAALLTEISDLWISEREISGRV